MACNFVAKRAIFCFNSVFFFSNSSNLDLFTNAPAGQPGTGSLPMPGMARSELQDQLRAVGARLQVGGRGGADQVIGIVPVAQVLAPEGELPVDAEHVHVGETDAPIEQAETADLDLAELRVGQGQLGVLPGVIQVKPDLPHADRQAVVRADGEGMQAMGAVMGQLKPQLQDRKSVV